MPTPPNPQERNRHIPSLGIAMFLVFCGVLLLLTYYAPSYQGTEFDPDEGINAIKALLYSRGYNLYEQIWSDQPPAFTTMLSGWFSIFGFNLEAGRILITIFSALLCCSLFCSIAITSGLFSGIIGVYLLLITPNFFTLSHSLMIGVPALALATLAALLAILHSKTKRIRYLILSSVALALAFLTKLFIAPVAIAIAVNIIVTHFSYKKSKVENLLKITPLMFLYGATLAVTTLLFITLLAPHLIGSQIQQLVLPHVKASYAFKAEPWSVIREIDPLLLYLTLLGIIAKVIRKEFDFILPLTWLLVASYCLSTHAPVWYHHFMLLNIPLVWLASQTFGEIIFHLSSFKYPTCKRWHSYLYYTWYIFIIGGFCFVLYEAPIRISMVRRNIEKVEKRTLDVEMMKHVKVLAPDTKLVLTDKPIYAFLAELSVVPELAVISLKRKYSNFFNTNDFVAAIEKNKPEQIIIGRFRNLNAAIAPQIKNNYKLVYSNNRNFLYQKNKILED